MVSGITSTSLTPAWSSSGATALRPPVNGVVAIQAVRSRDLALSLTTTEGDTVTLSLHAESDLTAVSYRGLRRGHGHGRGRGGVTAASSGQQQTVDVSVTGDLNAQEKADIAALVQRIGDVAQRFFTDHLDSAKRMLATFGDLGTIQRFTFEASQQQSTTVLAAAGDATSSGADTGVRASGDATGR